MRNILQNSPHPLTRTCFGSILYCILWGVGGEIPPFPLPPGFSPSETGASVGGI